MMELQEDFNWVTAVLVFITYVLIDIVYTLYIIYVEKRYAIKASVSSSLIYALMAFGVVSYSKNILYLIPLILGAFVGTYLVVRFKK